MARNFETWLGRRKHDKILLLDDNTGPHTAALNGLLDGKIIDTFKSLAYSSDISCVLFRYSLKKTQRYPPSKLGGKRASIHCGSI